MVQFSIVSAIEKRDVFLGAYLEMQRNRRANERSDRLTTGGPRWVEQEKSIARVKETKGRRGE